MAEFGHDYKIILEDPHGAYEKGVAAGIVMRLAIDIVEAEVPVSPESEQLMLDFTVQADSPDASRQPTNSAKRTAQRRRSLRTTTRQRGIGERSLDFGTQ